MVSEPKQSPVLAAGGPRPGLVAVRGPSGRLYGMLDPTTLVIEFQRGGQVERIDLSVYRTTKS